MYGTDMVRLYNAAMGENITAGELISRGERISNIAKVINVREGFSRVEDKVPEVWFDPMKSPEGTLEMHDYYKTKVITRDDVSRILDDYYEERGWDIGKGIPTRKRLEQLSLKQYAKTI